MAESLLLPLVRGVVGKAGDALVQRVARMWGIDKDRAKLEDRLVYVSSMLADAEVKADTNPAVKRWMRNLKAVAYQADDVLDHFQYEALRRQVQSNTSKVLNHFTRDSPLLFRLKMSRELKNVLDKIEGLVSDMKTFRLMEQAEVPQVLYHHRQTHSALDESEDIFGRDDDKEAVVNLLLDQQDQQSVQVLPIIGMGGSGKTTLAKMVYNDTRVEKHFELKMWHCVSEHLEATAVLKSIIQLATRPRSELPDTIELLRRELHEAIGRKRFLLVLDDVWNEDERKWEDDLKPLLCPSGGTGSMIVVTSRSQRVASIMGTRSSYELICLNEDDSWKLFSKRAFSTETTEEHTELVMIGRRIVSKCKGLPLALKTMGGLMSSKQAVQEWAAIADSNISDTSRGKDEVMSVLKLSYKHLSYEMKQCFAFCAIFPKDYVMDKDKLIQLWMANNFIRGEGMIDSTKKGELVFNELVWRSFLQDVKDYEQYGRFFDHMTITCKMHDLMHDLAKDATEECASAEELIQGKVLVNCVHHIKMSSDERRGIKELREIKGLLKSTSSLRTLLTESGYKDFKELKLKSLRALCCTEPSNSLFKYARHLRHLDVSRSGIKRLPDSICTMYNLESLRLDYCYSLQYLPGDMARSLTMLRHINLSNCYSLEEMPPKLSLLHDLHTLTRFVVGTKDGCGIEELEELRQLSNRLELYNLRKVKRGSKPNLHEKHNLCELVLNWGRERGPHKGSDILTDVDFTNEEEILESLVPPRGLKLLYVHGYHGLEISKWMRDPQIFQCLRKLKISDCPRCKDIPLVWLSPSLERLHLVRMDNLTTLCGNIDVETAGYSKVFPRLKSMTLNGLPNLERWTEEPHSLVMFPLLEQLEVSGCKKLATLPKAPLLTHLSSEGFVPMYTPLAAWPSLVTLNVGLLANVDMSLEEQRGRSPNTPEALKYLHTIGDDAFASVFNIPKLQLELGRSLALVETLHITGLCHIVRWPVEELRFLPRLQYLDIYSCKLEGKSSSSQEILPLPLLKYLSTYACMSLLEIPRLPVSLEVLSISRCDHLATLPDGMDGLTSLQQLRIDDCPRIEEFSQGLLQRLPSLKSLLISGCPDLERRCSEVV